MTAVSVISSSSASAGRSPACSAESTPVSKLGSSRLRGETFTATVMSCPARRQAVHCLTAVHNTHSVSGNDLLILLEHGHVAMEFGNLRRGQSVGQ